MKIKICGLTTFDSIRSSVQSGADYIGFVFYAPSPRDVSAQKAIALSRHIPQNIKTVAVIVDAGDEQIDSILR
jgi:phosphoribosylanthranilate isomerase